MKKQKRDHDQNSLSTPAAIVDGSTRGKTTGLEQKADDSVARYFFTKEKVIVGDEQTIMQFSLSQGLRLIVSSLPGNPDDASKNKMKTKDKSKAEEDTKTKEKAKTASPALASTTAASSDSNAVKSLPRGVYHVFYRPRQAVDYVAQQKPRQQCTNIAAVCCNKPKVLRRLTCPLEPSLRSILLGDGASCKSGGCCSCGNYAHDDDDSVAGFYDRLQAANCCRAWHERHQVLCELTAQQEQKRLQLVAVTEKQTDSEQQKDLVSKSVKKSATVKSKKITAAAASGLSKESPPAVTTDSYLVYVIGGLVYFLNPEAEIVKGKRT